MSIHSVTGLFTRRAAVVAIALLAVCLLTPVTLPVHADPVADDAPYREPSIGAAPARYSGTAPVTLTVLHLNDFHAAFDPVSAGYDEDGASIGLVGGIARLSGAINARRDDVGDDRAILLVAGDHVTGHRIDGLTENRASIAMLNAMKADALTLGNHEFDLSARHCFDLFTGRIASAESDPTIKPSFPWLAANLRYNGKRVAAPYCWLDPARTGGLRVAVIGLITQSLLTTTSPSLMKGIEVTDTEAAAIEALDAIERAGGADVTILLTHCGLEHDRRIAARTAIGKRVNAIVSGDDHRATPAGEMVNGVLISQAGADGRFLGEMSLTFDPNQGKVVDASARLIEIHHGIATATDPVFKDDPAMVALYESWLAKADIAGAKAVIGSARGALVARPSGYESNLGTFVARAMLVTAQQRDPTCEIALMNLGGLRGSYGKGDITLADVWRVHPFGNEVVIVELTGSEIRAAIASEIARGRPLQLCGLSVETCPLLKADQRVLSVSRSLAENSDPIEPIVDSKTYRVAVNSYMAEQANKYLGVAEARVATLKLARTGVLDRACVAAALREAGSSGVSHSYVKCYRIEAPPLDRIADVETLSLGEFRYMYTADADTLNVYGLTRSLRFMGVDAEETFKNDRNSGLSKSEAIALANRDFDAYLRRIRNGDLRPAKVMTPMGEWSKDWAYEYLDEALRHSDGFLRLEVDSARRMLGYFDRYLVHIIVQRDDDGDGTTEDVNFNEATIRAGLTPYSMKYGYVDHPGAHDRFEAAMATARKDGVGIWNDRPPFDQRHYTDYDERLVWWRIRGDQQRWYDDQHGDGSRLSAPLRLGDMLASERLARAREGKTITVFGAISYANENALTIALSHFNNHDVLLKFATPEAFASAWNSRMDGEFIVATGKFERSATSDAITDILHIERAGDVSRVPDNWERIGVFETAKATALLDTHVHATGTLDELIVSSGGGAVFLRFDRPDGIDRADNGLGVVVLRRQFSSFNADDGDEVVRALRQFEGKVVTVSGRVTSYEDRPQIVLSGPGQIREGTLGD